MQSIYTCGYFQEVKLEMFFVPRFCVFQVLSNEHLLL